MSTDCQKATAKAIPSTRTVTVNDADHMPHDYSTTPGGTLFSTTPGGAYCLHAENMSCYGHTNVYLYAVKRWFIRARRGGSALAPWGQLLSNATEGNHLLAVTRLNANASW